MKRQNGPANRDQNRISIDLGYGRSTGYCELQAENRVFEGSSDPPPDPPETGLEII